MTHPKFILKMDYMGNRPQRTLHADEMFTSESHRSVRNDSLEE